MPTVITMSAEESSSTPDDTLSSAPPPTFRQHDHVAAAVWAHHKWPRIGLVTGIGVGIVLSLLLALGWWAIIVAIVGLACAGCLLGYLAAVVLYPRGD